MSCSENALVYYEDSYNCAQAVLAGCRCLTGLDEHASLAISGGFGGGMRHGGVCGAVTGGLMALGLIFPYDDNKQPQAREKIGKISLELQSRFSAENGCLDCKGLIKNDKAAARQNTCPKAVASAARIVEEMASEFK